jgi:tetratricopeptide (TPR) repeat protein
VELLQAGQEERGLSDLRRELAEGERSLEAALALASYLASRGRVAEALAAVEAGLLRHDKNPELSLARAELLRDLGQRDEAARALRDRLESGGSHPLLWFELAELEWLLGHGEEARAALARMRQDHSGHEWVEQQAAVIEKLELEMETNAYPVSITARDLLGDLRGAPQAMIRFQALRMLASDDDALRRRAVNLALGDRDPALRVEALRLGDWTLAQAEMLSRRALTDEAPSVRAAALPLARRIDPRIAGPMVLEALDRETNPDNFRLMHGALREISGTRLSLPPGAAEDPEARAAVVSRWREVWHR